VVVIDDDPVVRVRGGGTSEGGRIQLTSIPQDEWLGKLVYSRCLIEGDGNQQARTVVGNVTAVCSNGEIQVKVFLHMKRGTVAPHTIALDAKAAYIVQKGSNKWKEAQKSMPFHRFSNKMVDPVEHPKDEQLMQTTPSQKTQVPSFLQMTRQERLEKILKSVGSTKQPFVQFGMLLEQCFVYWHPLDQHALYIREAEVETKDTMKEYTPFKRICSKQEIATLYNKACAVLHDVFKEVTSFWTDNGSFTFDALSHDEEEAFLQCWKLASDTEKEVLLLLVNWVTVAGADLSCLPGVLSNGHQNMVTAAGNGLDWPSLQNARALLLSIVQSLPRAFVQPFFHTYLYSCTSEGPIMNSFASAVAACQTVGGLIHLYAHLLYCVNLDMLPANWKSEGSEWQSAQSLLVAPSLSTFFLHAQVFHKATKQATDKAVGQPTVVFRGLKINVFPPNYVELTQNLLALAQTAGLRLWPGPHEETCYSCQKRMSLFHCSVCPFVLCTTCYAKYKLPTPVKFLCHSCLVDLPACQSISEYARGWK
jgi:hypothetical protein